MTKKTNHTKDEQSEVRGIEEIVNEVYPEHYSCEDCWYSCPLHPDSCAEGDECDCRLEEKRKNLTQTLQHIQERHETEKRELVESLAPLIQNETKGAYHLGYKDGKNAAIEAARRLFETEYSLLKKKK